MTDYEKKYFTQLTEVIETIQKALFKIDERLKELEKYAPNGVQYDQKTFQRVRRITLKTYCNKSINY